MSRGGPGAAQAAAALGIMHQHGQGGLRVDAKEVTSQDVVASKVYCT